MPFDVAALVGETSPRTELATALLAMLAARQPGAWEHATGAALWAKRLCTALDVRAESKSFVTLCAILHDIGMVCVPETIVTKPGPLNAVEWQMIHGHPASGERILSGIAELQACGIVVRAHHERFDGSGYPDGLRGLDTPFEARLVAVADAFHAMVSERAYRAAIPPRRALEILVEGRGTQWDPLAVEGMLGLFERARPHLDWKPGPHQTALA